MLHSGCGRRVLAAQHKRMLTDMSESIWTPRGDPRLPTRNTHNGSATDVLLVMPRSPSTRIPAPCCGLARVST